VSVPAASICFEIWGVVDSGQQDFDFSRQISEKFRFVQAISRKISISLGKFLKNFNFFQVNLWKMSIFSDKFSKNFDFFQAI